MYVEDDKSIHEIIHEGFDEKVRRIVALIDFNYKEGKLRLYKNFG